MRKRQLATRQILDNLIEVPTDCELKVLRVMAKKRNQFGYEIGEAAGMERKDRVHVYLGRMCRKGLIERTKKKKIEWRTAQCWGITTLGEKMLAEINNSRRSEVVNIRVLK